MAVRPAVPAVPHQSHAIARWAVLQSEPALWAAWTPAPIAASVFSACSNKEGAMGEFCTPLGCSVPQPCTAQALQKQLISGTQPSPSAPPSPVEHAVDFLTQRCVSCRSPAAHSMPLRPGLQHLHSQLVDLLQSVGQDTSVSLVIMGDHGAGKTLVRSCAQDPACNMPAHCPASCCSAPVSLPALSSPIPACLPCLPCSSWSVLWRPCQHSTTQHQLGTRR